MNKVSLRLRKHWALDLHAGKGCSGSFDSFSSGIAEAQGFTFSASLQFRRSCLALLLVTPEREAGSAMRKTMTRKAGTIKRLIDRTKGKIFVCRFTKRTTGTRRKMLARTGVYKRIVADKLARRMLGQPPSKGLQFDPADKDLALVFDIQKQAFRMIDLNTVEFFRCGNLYYNEKENEK